MALCEQCGSIQIDRARRKPTDRLVAFFTSKRPFVCRRCGWRARRGWTDLDLDNLRDYGAGGAEPDPSLTVLDGDGPAGSARQRGQEAIRKRDGETTATSESESFDPATLDLANTSATPPGTDSQEELSAHAPIQEHRSVRKRQTRSPRREIVATIAVTALVMFVVVSLGVTRSCGGAQL